jgi:hypothetical protein
VKAFGRSARGQAVPLEQWQFDAAHHDPDNYYAYVVDNVANPAQTIAVRVLQRATLLMDTVTAGVSGDRRDRPASLVQGMYFHIVLPCQHEKAGLL